MGKTRDLFKKIRDTHVRDLNLSHCNDYLLRDFPRSPVVKTLPSNEGGMGSNPSWGVKIPYACHQKIRSNIVINSIKTLKKRKNL